MDKHLMFSYIFTILDLYEICDYSYERTNFNHQFPCSLFWQLCYTYFWTLKLMYMYMTPYNQNRFTHACVWVPLHFKKNYRINYHKFFLSMYRITVISKIYKKYLYIFFILLNPIEIESDTIGFTKIGRYNIC